MRLEIDTDFECANALDIRRVGDTEFVVHPRPDQCTNVFAHAASAYNVAFRVVNHGPTAQEATVSLHAGRGKTVAWRKLGDHGEARVDDWRPVAGPVDPPGLNEEVRTVRIEVPAHGVVDVATMYWMSATQVMDRLADIDAEHGEIAITSLGTTHEGRKIPAIDLSALGPKDGPVRVVSATPQSSELGTIAVMGLLDRILSGGLEDVVGTSKLVLLPLTNPDGNAHGMCMSNAVRQNVIFGFGDVGTERAPLECTAVWDYLMDLHPEFFLEFHSYPHLNRPSFRPYVFDLEFFPEGEPREKAKTFYDALIRVSPSPLYRVNRGSVDEQNFASSLVQKLIREKGMPATIYKLHNRETVADNVHQAARVVRELARSVKGSRDAYS